jgi:predicted TIM-barrel fold metal-dependent hydrolase
MGIEDGSLSKGPSRRSVLAMAAATGAMAATGAAEAQPLADIPIIDAHIHLFDGRRPLGAGYMGSQAYRALSQTSLPQMYAPLARPSGIVGAIVVESSGWIDDTAWYLEQCRTDPIMVGVCGSLDPGSADFGRYVTRFRKDPFFRAIRSSRFFQETNGKVALKPDQVTNLKLLAEADLVLDTANPSMGLMTANVMLADAIPNLRIIMDHLPSFDPTPQNRAAYEAVVRDMAARPNIHVKLSEVYHPTADGKIVTDYAFLRDRLEYLFQAFGEDRVIFGSDYPNSYGVASIPETVALVRRFFSTKSREAAEKYFWKNSARVYKWVRQAPDQPALA